MVANVSLFESFFGRKTSNEEEGVQLTVTWTGSPEKQFNETLFMSLSVATDYNSAHDSVVSTLTTFAWAKHMAKQGFGVEVTLAISKRHN